MKLQTVLKKLKGYRHTHLSTPNQSVTVFENGNVLTSYDSIIAVRIDHQIYLTNKWDYSATTGRHRNYYLCEGIAETREKIKSNVYKMVE